MHGRAGTLPHTAQPHTAVHDPVDRLQGMLGCRQISHSLIDHLCIYVSQSEDLLMQQLTVGTLTNVEGPDRADSLPLLPSKAPIALRSRDS